MWLEAPTSPRSRRGYMRVRFLFCRQVATSAPDTNSVGRHALDCHPESAAADEGTAFCNKTIGNADSLSLPTPRNDRGCMSQQPAKSPGMNTCAKSSCNPRRINTYKITRLKVALE